MNEAEKIYNSKLKTVSDALRVANFKAENVISYPVDTEFNMRTVDYVFSDASVLSFSFDDSLCASVTMFIKQD